MTYITAYNPLPIEFVRGQGVWLWDKDGKQYLDGLAGIAVSSLGHAHPNVINTIKQQVDKLIHLSNVVRIPQEFALAEKLTQVSGMQQVFFSNSGAEANEAAIKLARLYGHKQDIEKPEIIVTEKAFHGRTMATLTASGSRKSQAGFEPLVPGFTRAPFNDVAAIETIAKNSPNVVAILVEPIQGEGGIIVPDDQYLNHLRNICDQNHWLLMLDEVQTGIGRTGRWYAYQHNKIQPDVVTSAKALANGIPIAACLMYGAACDLFQPGNHGATFGGNPLSSATAMTVLETIEHDKLLPHAEKMGNLLKELLREHLAEIPEVVAIRGKGLMVGVELDRPCRPVLLEALKERVLFSVTAEKVIRIVPPLIIQQEEVFELVQRLKRAVKRFVTAADE